MTGTVPLGHFPDRVVGDAGSAHALRHRAVHAGNDTVQFWLMRSDEKEAHVRDAHAHAMKIDPVSVGP